jgi:hypothetical protein
MLLLLAAGCSGDEYAREVVADAPARADVDGPVCRPGVNPGAPVWDGTIVLDEARVAGIAAAGVKTVRLDFRREGEWDDAAFARYDTIIAGLHGAGITVHGLVTYEAITASQEQWNDDADGDGMNAAVVEFADTFAVLAGRYGDRIARWELWNEPNCYGVDPTDDPQHAGCYYVLPRVLAHMVAESYLRVRDSVDAGSIQLVVGGLLAQDVHGPLNTGADYLQSFYAESVWGWLEEQTGRRYPWSGIGIHPYTDQDRATDGAQLLAVVDAIEGVMNANGDLFSTLPVTEMGWSVASVDSETQSANLTTAYDVLGQRPRIDEISWFSYTDAPSAGLYFGLVDEQGAARPAYAAMQAMVQACGGE